MHRMSDGVRIAVRSERPSASGTPVVLIHGGPGLWDYLAPLGDLITDRPVHGYDQRGCGSSDPSEDQTLERALTDLDELRERLGLYRWIVLGHSYGAALGLLYAARYPASVAGLVHLSGVGIGDWRTPFRAEQRRRRTDTEDERLRELSALPHRDPSQEREFRVLSWFIDYVDPVVGVREAARMAEHPAPINQAANRAIGSDLEALGDRGMIAAARRITCPALFLHGADDPRPWQCARALADHVTGAQWALLPAPGHLPWVEQPARMGELLRDFTAPLD